MKWVPILSGDSAIRAREAVDAIADALVSRNFVLEGRSAGRWSVYEEALFFGYMAAAYPETEWADRAVESLNAAIDKANETAGYLGLHGGLSGLGWTVEHLSRLLREAAPEESSDASERESVSEDDQDLTADINAALVSHLHHAKSGNIYDLISGLVGFGIYFLERWPNPSAMEGIKAVFDRLEGLAEHTQEGITWHTGAAQLPDWQLQQCPNGYYNLGVAHGVPGIIHLLAQISETNVIEPERLNPLLEGALTWMLAQQRPSGSRSRFSSWVGPGVESSDSRLGWCYGDLGILAVLLQVARRTGRREWQVFAADLLDHCLAWPHAEGNVLDAPLCHGAAGVAHIFNRIYQSEGDPRCRDAAAMWFERTLAMRQPGSGVGGFSAFMMPDLNSPSVWEANPAFLDGAIGVALALLAAITTIEPKWDRLLLLSFSPINRASIETGRVSKQVAEI